MEIQIRQQIVELGERLFTEVSEFKQIVPVETHQISHGFHFAGLQAGNMAGFDFAHQAVHNLLQRLDLAGGVTVVLLERIHGAVHDILNGGLQNGKIVDRFVAEVDGFFLNFLPGLEQVDRVVRDALQVIDGVQQGVEIGRASCRERV